MNEMTFPFWIVKQWRGLLSFPVELEDMPGFIATFTTADRAAKFMSERGEMEWQKQLVVRATLPSLLEQLRQLGVQGVCLDPSRSGCGMRLDLEELDGR